MGFEISAASSACLLVPCRALLHKNKVGRLIAGMLERRVDGGYQARVAYSPDEVCAPLPLVAYSSAPFWDRMFTHVSLHV